MTHPKAQTDVERMAGDPELPGIAFDASGRLHVRCGGITMIYELSPKDLREFAAAFNRTATYLELAATATNTGTPARH